MLSLLSRLGWIVLVGVVGGGWLWACGPGDVCKADGDCAAATYCDVAGGGKCKADCASSADCGAGGTCTERKRCQGIDKENPGDGGLPEGTEATQESQPDATPSEGKADTSIPGKSPLCPVESRECYSGAAGTQGKGPCKAGKQRCVEGTWGPCVGEIAPKPEQCNGQDDDCDGTIDGNCTTWASSFGGKGGEEGQGIAVAPSGHLYVTGSFVQNATFGTTTLFSKGESDAFVAKLDGTGQVVWASALGGSGSDGGRAVATDASGNLVAAGFFEGSITLGSVALTSKGGKNLYVAKFDDKGQVLWAVALGGATGSIEVSGLFVDKAGSAYLTGSFADKADFGQTALTSKGGLDAFAAKLDDKGQVVWAASGGGTDNEEAFAITADDAGNAYITGYYQGMSSFGSATLSSVNFTNAFIAKVSSTGQFVWASGTGRSWYAAGKGIQVDSSGAVTVAGYFEESALFGSKLLQSQKGTEIFVARLSATGQFSWVISASGYANNPGRGLGIDGSGNFYLVGTFAESVSFGVATANAQGPQDLYVAKVSADGKFAAVKTLHGQELKSGEFISVDQAGKAYIIGTFRGSLTADTTTLTSKGYTDIFVAKVQLP